MMNRTEFLRKVAQEWDLLMKTLDQVPRKEVEILIRNWSVKDIMGHISSWEAEAMKAMDEWKNHKTPRIFSVNFEKEGEALNLRMAEAKKGYALEKIQEEMEETHADLVEKIASLSEKEFASLGEKGSTGHRGAPGLPSPLLDFLAGCTYQHYAEHAGKIKEWRGAATRPS